MGLAIEKIDAPRKEAWETFIAGRDDTTFVDSWHWRDVIEKVYRLPHYWYAAIEHGKVVGVLGLTLSRHPLFGSYLATAPFANYGGFYFESEAAARLLLEKAEELGRCLGVRHVNLRHPDGGAPSPPGWQQEGIYATYWLELPSEPQVFLHEHLRASTRRHISKSLGNGFSIEFGGTALLADFWQVMIRSMKELGSPYHSRHYLETILATFAGKAELAVTYTREHQPFGASLLVSHNRTVVQLHANVLSSYRHLYPGEYLYWSVIAECCRRGVKRLDLGRSLLASGNERFKMKWRPVKVPLAYWYHLAPGSSLPRLHQANPRLRLAVGAWRRLPLWLHNAAGPRLISGIL